MVKLKFFHFVLLGKGEGFEIHRDSTYVVSIYILYIYTLF